MTLRRAVFIGMVTLAVTSCFRLQRSDGGGEAFVSASRSLVPQDVAVPEGYMIEGVAIGLTYPTDAAFDDAGRLYVIESGYSYGDTAGAPRLLRVDGPTSFTTIATGRGGPWNGVEFHDGAFYVAGGHELEGKVVRIGLDGSMEDVIAGLPSQGDHHTNGPAIRDGWIYFGQGTVTNSGVVGLDNFDYGWVQNYPDVHDVPCHDHELVALTFRTPDPRTDDPDDMVETGAFQPFGSAGRSGETVRGELPCSGSIMRIRPDGSSLELVASGMRNPFGLAFAPDGTLYATENQADVRGSRPVFGVGDLLWRVERGTWYGWPDFFAGVPLTEDAFAPPGKEAPGFLLAEHPGTPPRPAAVLGVHSSSNGLAFSTSATFGYVGEAFVAQFGDMAPKVGKTLSPVGYKVIRVDPQTGIVNDFAVNVGERNGPASWLGTGGLERPVSVVFDRTGESLYIVDFGVMAIHDERVLPRRGTGSIWRISRTTEAP